MNRLVRTIRDLSLRGKVTLTLAVVFTGSVLVLLLALVPILRDQRHRLVEQDRRLLSTLRRNAERDFIYDLLSENRESLAVHLGALARQEGVLWARIEAEGLDIGATADTGAIRRLLGDAARPFLDEPEIVLRVDQEGHAELVGAGAALATGCVIGNILSGWAMMSVGMLLFGVVTILANWGTTVLYLRGLK